MSAADLGSLPAAPPAPWRLAAVAAPLHAVAGFAVLVGYSLAPLGVLNFLMGAENAGGLNRLAVLAAGLIAVVGLCARGGRGLAVSAPLCLILALTAWAGLSTFWSIAPETTLGRAIAFAAAIPAGLYLASFSWPGLARLIAAAVLALSLAGIAAWAALPELGRMAETHVGAFRGLWPHKSTAGVMLAIGFTAAAALAWRRNPLWWALGAFFAGLSVWAQSMTGLLGMAGAVGALILVWLVRAGPVAATLALGAGVAAALLGALLLPIVQTLLADVMGRDATFTGRTDIWRVLSEDVGAHLALGHGFGAFWVTPEGPVAQVNAALEFAPGSAHNAWLEALVALGWPGLVLQALVILGVAIAALGAAPRRDSAYLAMALIAAFLAVSASESLLLEPDAMLWPLLVALGAQKGLHRYGRIPTQP